MFLIQQIGFSGVNPVFLIYRKNWKKQFNYSWSPLIVNI